MPRARIIKPDFFFDEELAELPSDAQLLFIALWMAADREGRLEDKPRVIKARVFPFGRGDIVELLEMLAEANFIERYECNGKRYIQIRSFTKHQHPNVREPASNIPAPALHVHARAKDVLGTTLKDASPPGAVAVTVTVTEAVEREREMHALHASLSFSRKLESIVQEIEADPLYASRKDIRKVAAKRRTWLGRDPTKREILSWLNSEKAEVNDDGGSSEQIARVVANLGRDN